LKLLSVALLLIFSSWQAVWAQTCAYCFYKPTQDRYGCKYSCTDPGDGCGGCCVLPDYGNACYVGGCCLIQGQNGFRYETTGNSCENFSCPMRGVPDLRKNTESFDLKASSSSGDLILLGEVPWIADKNFPSRLERYSPSMARAVALFQDVVQSAPKTSMKAYGVRTFSGVLRPNFPARVKVSHATTDKWAVYLEKADTEKEGPNAPVMLQIDGNRWIMYRALSSPGPDGHLRQAVAQGTVQ